MAVQSSTPTGEPAPARATCDMWGGRCGRPATLVVDAEVLIGTGYEPLTWHVCDSVPCLIAANLHAEGIGRHVNTRPLTAAAAEAVIEAVGS